MNTNLNIAQDVIGQISFAIEQRPEAVAQLFADYGINAPVSESSVMDAIVVFKDPFLGELNAIIEGGTDSILGIGKGKGKKNRAENQDENHNTKKPLQKLGGAFKKVLGGNKNPIPGEMPSPNPEPEPSPTPLPNNPSSGGSNSKLNLSNVIDTAATVTQSIKDTKNAVFNMSDKLKGRNVDESALKTKLRQSSSDAATAKEDKLLGMPKALAIGLIVVAILIVIFIIMRMRNK